MAIKVLIAHSSVIIREGIKTILSGNRDIIISGEAHSSDDLISGIKKYNPSVVFIDYSSSLFKIDDIRFIIETLPDAGVIAITETCDRSMLTYALHAGLTGHLLNCCDEKEINNAVIAVSEKKNFYCGKILEFINLLPVEGNFTSCAPITLSKREMEIIAHIADGLTNKQIADKLFLSAHTVMTHRKNIMNKLSVNNTAGIVMYAVKERMLSPNKFLFAPGKN